jgi:hypothetical protein
MAGPVCGGPDQSGAAEYHAVSQGMWAGLRGVQSMMLTECECRRLRESMLTSVTCWTAAVLVNRSACSRRRGR